MKPTLPNLLVAVQLVIFGLILVAIIALPIAETSLLRWIGLAAMVGGLWLVFAAISQHRVNAGINITPVPRENSQLIETGLYKRIRHPIYTGVILGAIGAGLFHGHIVTLLLGVSLLPFFWYKSTVEEGLLRQEFDDYARYMQRSGRFIPPLLKQKERDS